MTLTGDFDKFLITRFYKLKAQKCIYTYAMIEMTATGNSEYDK